MTVVEVRSAEYQSQSGTDKMKKAAEAAFDLGELFSY